LETGADDFLANPFNVRELKARVNAMFRRPRRPALVSAPAVARETAAASSDDHEILEHGPLPVDVDGRRAFNDGAELTLTRTEFDLLTQLMRSPARVWSRTALLRSVWDTEWASDTHLVEVHVGNLRKKLGEAPDGPLHQDGARRRVPDGGPRLAPRPARACY
jgi:DNA-binding response OmpR family regulator